MKKQIDNPPLSPACRLIGQFGNRWALVTLITLREHGTLRFRELLAAVPGGISERMLASTLQELESLGLISRTAYPEMNILGDFSFDYTDFLLADQAVSDDIYIAHPVPLEPGGEVESFYARYREKYGAEPTQWAVQLYDSVRMVVDTAVRIGSTDPEDIAQALRSEEGYEGIGGTIAFDQQGRLAGRAPRIMVSRDGMFDFVEE